MPLYANRLLSRSFPAIDDCMLSFDGNKIIDSSGALSPDEVPGEHAIVGASAIGLEGVIAGETAEGR